MMLIIVEQKNYRLWILVGGPMTRDGRCIRMSGQMVRL